MFLRFDDPLRATVLTDRRDGARALVPDGAGWTERWRRLDARVAYEALAAMPDRADVLDRLRQALTADGGAVGGGLLQAEDEDILLAAADRLRDGWLVEIDRIAPSGGWRGEEPKPAPADEEAIPPAESPTGVPAKKERDHWITVQLVGEDGGPVPNEKVKVTDPGGAEHEGETDSQGQFTVTGIPEGDCTITFPELDQEAWEAADA